MQKIILDENVPRPLRQALGNHLVSTIQEQGWKGIENGELLALLENNFDVFITADKNLRYQQNPLGAKDRHHRITFQLPARGDAART